jgi:N6-L-threonylcarbamoyladenine synthase
VIVLGIETSCDDTAAAVAVDGRGGRPALRSNVVASQMAQHRPYGGVVPEIASRSHVRFVTEVVAEALRRARISLRRVDAVAATAGPGLPGSLLVGLTAAKSLAYLLRRPLIAVNHIEAHVLSGYLADPPATAPLLALVASGGHTELIAMPRIGTFRILGRTRDDAAGEAYDKAAKLLGLEYPGGPALERAARQARRRVSLPIARIKDGALDFSFSGLKTAVARAVARGDADRAALAAGFQEAVITALEDRTRRALRETRSRTLVLAGGVAANGALRARFAAMARELGVTFVVPPPALCTDNAGMVAAAGWFAARRHRFAPLDTPADAGWTAGTPVPRAEPAEAAA